MSNRFVAALCLAALLAVPAHAEWIQEEIRWQISSQGNQYSATNIHVRDTAYAVLSGDTRDTTGEFSTRWATPIPRGAAFGHINSPGTAPSNSGSDSTILGWLVFQPDSAAAPTATLTSMTVLIDGRAITPNSSAVTLARGWVKADSALVNGAAGGTLILADESVAIPVRTVSPYGNTQRWSTLRARQTAATGILSGSVRVFWRYWRPDWHR